METENTKLARRIVEEGFGGNNPDLVRELSADDFIEHQRGMRGAEGALQAIRDLNNAFPDISYKLVNAIAEDDLVCVHYRCSGTHKRALGPMQPTGKRFEIDVMDIMRFRGGKLAEHWGSPDRLGLMEELGFWPPRPANDTTIASLQA